MPNSVFLIASNSLTLLPAADNTYDLGSSSFRWANLYAVNVKSSNIGIGITPLASAGLFVQNTTNQLGIRIEPTGAASTQPMIVFQRSNGTVTGMFDPIGTFRTNLSIGVAGGFSMTLNPDGTILTQASGLTGLSDMIDVVGDTTYGIVSRASSAPSNGVFTGQDVSANFTSNIGNDGRYMMGAGSTFASMDTGLSRTAAATVAFGNGAAGDTSGTVISANRTLTSAGTTSGTVTSSQKVVKNITAIANASATPTFTITIPNAAHSASVRVAFAGSLGAGGAVGANEATGVIAYDIAVARTAGVAAVATISSAYGSATSSVAGAATITITAAMSTVSGGVGATNTFTVNVTISHGSGSSTNHTCVCTGEIINANATGITLS